MELGDEIRPLSLESFMKGPVQTSPVLAGHKESHWAPVTAEKVQKSAPASAGPLWLTQLNTHLHPDQGARQSLPASATTCIPHLNMG